MVSLLACNQESNVESYVAKVYETYLPKAEVEKFIPKGTSPDDSTLMAESYTRNWITKQLLLHLANTNLDDSVKRLINRQVNDYKISLLIHQYKQEFINKKLVINITDDEINSYYNTNKENFILPTSIAKVLFIIVPKSGDNTKTINEIGKLLKSSRDEDISRLEEMSVMVAKKYDNFDTAWIEVNRIFNLIPGDVEELEKSITKQKYIEKSDSLNHYFLRIDKFMPKQTVAPIEYVRDEIRMILENQHKINFEYEFENQINQNARETNNITIY